MQPNAATLFGKVVDFIGSIFQKVPFPSPHQGNEPKRNTVVQLSNHANGHNYQKTDRFQEEPSDGIVQAITFIFWHKAAL